MSARPQVTITTVVTSNIKDKPKSLWFVNTIVTKQIAYGLFVGSCMDESHDLSVPPPSASITHT